MRTSDRNQEKQRRVVKDYSNPLHLYSERGTRKSGRNVLRCLIICSTTTPYKPVLCQCGRPTLRAVDAAGAAPGLGAIFDGGAVPSPVPVLTPASGAPDALRWAATIKPGCMPTLKSGIIKVIPICFVKLHFSASESGK